MVTVAAPRVISGDRGTFFWFTPVDDDIKLNRG